MKLAKYILAAGFFCFGYSLFAQDQLTTKEKRKAEKQAKREAKQQAELEQMARINELLNLKEWVLEADKLEGKKGGQLFNISPNLNFLIVNGDEDATLQLALNGVVGWNGVGGVTVVGRLTRYEVMEDKNGGISSVRASIIGPGGNADILVYPSNYQSRVVVSGTWGNRVTLIGTIKHPSESMVFKGSTRYGN